MFAAGPPAQAQRANSRTDAEIEKADQDYPKAFACMDPRYATQVDDKPGKCPDGKSMEQIRLGLAYKCLRGPAEYQATEGPCRYTPEQPKVAVTASVFWTCKSAPDKRLLNPGTCSDGSRAQIGFEERPHGDHNPRHGGPGIFMNDKDLSYHVEGTYTSDGVFHAFFYNEFTKPRKIAGVTGRVAVANSNSVATGPEIPLQLAPIADGNELDAHIPNAPVPSPDSKVFFKLYIKLKPTGPDWVTDHGPFASYSKDPAPPAPATSTGATRGAPATTRGGAQQPATTARGTPPSAPAVTPSATATKPAPPKPTPPAAAPPAAAPSVQTETPQPSGTIMAGGAEVGGGPTGPQVTLPEKTPDLLAFLKDNAAQVKQLLDEGQLGGMWYPALNAKDAGLELDAKHREGLTDAQRAKLASDVKQLTVAAWQIDAAGDLGNRSQLDQLTSDFQAQVSDILSLYGK